MSEVAVTLDTTDWQWLLDTFAFPATTQGQRVRAKIAAAIPPPPPPHLPVGPLALALSADGKSIHATQAPEGTKQLHVAFSSTQTSSSTEYKDFAVLDLTGAPTAIGPAYGASFPWVSAQADGAGAWTARQRLTVPEEPRPTEEPKSGGFTPGLVTNSDDGVPGLLHPAVVREEFSIDTSPGVVAAAAKVHHDAGRVLQPLAGAQGRIANEGEAKGLRAWAEACAQYGVTAIELENETNNQIANNKGDAEAYGHIAGIGVSALHGTPSGLLVQASDFGKPAGEWTQGVLKVLAGNRPLGYTIHPYPGQTSATGVDEWGGPMLERLVKLLEAFGDPTRIYGTEWGTTSDNGRVLSDGKAYNYEGAGQIIAHHSAALREKAKGRLAQLLYYQSHDQAASGSTNNREAFFGAVKADGSAKGQMTTAVQAFLASGS